MAKKHILVVNIPDHYELEDGEIAGFAILNQAYMPQIIEDKELVIAVWVRNDLIEALRIKQSSGDTNSGEKADSLERSKGLDFRLMIRKKYPMANTIYAHFLKVISIPENAEYEFQVKNGREEVVVTKPNGERYTNYLKFLK